MTDFTREYRLKHEKIFATECRRLKQKFVKGDGNPMQTLEKTEIVDFVELTSFPWKDEFHLKIFSPSGRVESAGLILAHCCGSVGLPL